jgi:tetratricopeptide (TPR) repeat protein
MSKHVVAAACLACALGLAVWGLWAFLAPRSLPADFPGLPDLKSQNSALRRLLQEADARVRSHPGSADEIGRLAMIYHSNQFQEQADGAYAIAARLASADYRWPYGRALVREERGEDPAALLRDSIRLKPDFLPALQKLADTYFKQGSLEEAARCYDSALSAGARPVPQAVFGLARIAARQSNWTRVTDLLLPLSLDYPLLRPARQLLAEAYEAEGRRQQSEAERGVLLRSDLTALPPIPDPFADELLGLCCSSTRLLKEAGLKSRFGAVDAAIAIARRAVEVEPGDADARHYLGRTLLDTRGSDPQAVDEALFQLTEGLRLKPEDRLPLWYFGTFFFRQPKTEGAIGRLRALLEQNSGTAEAQYYLGIVSFHQRNVPEAVSHYEEALKRNPEYAEAWHKLGLIRAAEGNTADAIAFFHQALRFKPTLPLARSNLGVALDQQGRTGEAIREFEEALRVHPDDGPTHMYLAIALTKSGQHETASRHFREAVRISPDDPEARYGFGCSLANSRDVKGAVEQLREALRLRPDFAEARAQLQRLTAKNFTK